MSAHLPIYVGAAALAAWIYLLFARGGFWRMHLRSAVASPPAKAVAIVPARNEAEFIARSASSLLHQQNIDISVVIVDDNSSDSTAKIAREAAGSSAKLMVIEGRDVPPGWTGKLWALQQGVEYARKSSPDYFLFTDADIQHEPQSVTRLVAIAHEGGYDLASFMVKLHCQSIPEKLLIPAFVFFFFKLYPPAWIADPRSKVSGAAGGCVLIRPETLARAGGLEVIRNQIIDDCSLARIVKRSGGSVWLGLTNSARSIRPYRSFGEIGRMISRTAFNQLGHSTAILLAAIIGLFLIYVAPLALLFSSSMLPIVFGLSAFTLTMVAYAPIVRFYKLNPLWTLTLPLAAIFYIGATVHSAITYWIGRGGEWKGRTQDPGTKHVR